MLDRMLYADIAKFRLGESVSDRTVKEAHIAEKIDLILFCLNLLFAVAFKVILNYKLPDAVADLLLQPKEIQTVIRLILVISLVANKETLKIKDRISYAQRLHIDQHRLVICKHNILHLNIAVNNMFILRHLKQHTPYRRSYILRNYVFKLD